jgi:hypothetical protein
MANSGLLAVLTVLASDQREEEKWLTADRPLNSTAYDLLLAMLAMLAI